MSNQPEVKERKAAHPNKGWLDREAYVANMEAKYGAGVTNPSQLAHVKELRRKQALEGESLQVRVQRKYGVENISQVPEVLERIRESNREAQARPEVLAKRLKSQYPEMRHVDEYVTLDHSLWAVEFEMATGQKPTLWDLQSYFNTKSPIEVPYESKEFFDLRDSYLELKFKSILEGLGFSINKDFYRRTRFLRRDGERYGKEIDFFFPEYMIGFEVQDFASHSQVEGEVGMRGLPKNGPAYSQDKIERAASYGVTLYEIWEDEFRDREALEKTIILCLMARLIDSETVGNLHAHELNQEERRQQFSSGTIRPLPDRIQPETMRVWWQA